MECSGEEGDRPKYGRNIEKRMQKNPKGAGSDRFRNHGGLKQGGSLSLLFFLDHSNRDKQKYKTCRCRIQK